MKNDYFDIKSVPYIGMNWIYVDAKKTLLIIAGKIENTDDIVCIKQYRPPLNKWVVSFPMGAFPIEGESDEYIKNITKGEGEAETGYKINHIEYLCKFARSPGLTNEIAIVFKAIYSPDTLPQVLHKEEEIVPLIINKDNIRDILENDDYIIDSSLLLVLGNYYKI
jgi:ADP-ribose pyrophosphatase